MDGLLAESGFKDIGRGTYTRYLSVRYIMERTWGYLDRSVQVRNNVFSMLDRIYIPINFRDQIVIVAEKG